MRNCRELLDNFINYLEQECDVRTDESSGSCILILPFQDSMGDNILIRISEINGYILLDDAGTTEATLFNIRETVGGKKVWETYNGLIASFGANRNSNNGTVEFKVESNEINDKILHFAKLLVTLDTMLIRISEEEKIKQIDRPHRHSLGPRASQKIHKSLLPLIKKGRVDYRTEINGLSVPDWLVDFAYKPSLKPISETCELIVLITVDLAVMDPIIKSTYAYSRAVDIKSAHDNYEIRIAFDTHGENSNTKHAANFLKEHEIKSGAYHSSDISKMWDYESFVSNINREMELKLRY